MAKSKSDTVADHSPWLPHPFEPADAAALQALQRGNANAEQQKRALKWLVACTTYYDLSYRPGVGGDRDTCFAEGKRAIGAQVVKLLNINIGLISETARRQKAP